MLTVPVSMYTVSIPVFIQHLNGLNTVLDKAAAWAAARKVNETDLLNMRLSPDMFNLSRQVRAATDHAANAAGRLSGKELLKFANDETTIAQLKDRITKTIDYLNKIKQSEIDGSETKDITITFPSGQTRQFTGQSLLLGNSLPNFFFHTTTAYDILRQCGVEIGKRDFMGTSNGCLGITNLCFGVTPRMGEARPSVVIANNKTGVQFLDGPAGSGGHGFRLIEQARKAAERPAR
jgi:hypothetical protein